MQKIKLPSDFLNSLDSDYGKDKWLAFLNQDEHQIFVSYESNTFLGFGAFHRDDEWEGRFWIV